jgi:Ser/Thr protein kinase RdoA (MazF antagonist)
MTTNVERRTQYFEPEKSAIEDLIIQYFPGVTVSSIELMRSGLANSNYCIILSNGSKYILRYHTRDSKISVKEFNLAKLIANEELVPKILFHDDSCKKADFPCSIITFHEGILLSKLLAEDNQIDNGKRIFSEIGKFVAHLNNTYKFEKPGLLDNQLRVKSLPAGQKSLSTVANYILSCLDNTKLQKRFDADNRDKLKQYIIANDHFIMETNEDSFLVHADLKPENILIKLVNGQYTLSAILDWEFCYSGSLYGDLGTLFRESRYNICEFKDSFAFGYTTVRPCLNQEWRKIASIIDLINLCDFLTSSSERPQLFKNSIDLILNTINELNINV